MSIYSASKLESLVFSNYYLRALFLTLKKVHVLFSSTKISFAESDSTSASTSRFTVMGVPVDKMARGLGRDYLRKYIGQRGRLFERDD